jgi:rubrerythrin
MKKVLTLLLVISSFSLYAQENKEARKERVHAFKVGFLTERLDLSPQEAQEFWPVYNAYDKEMEILRISEQEALRSYRKNADNLSEENAQKILSTLLKAEESRTALKAKLAKNLINRMSTKKVLALFKAEEDFKRRLLKELRNRRGRGSKN